MLRTDFVLRKLQLITDDLAHLAAYRDIGHEELVGNPIILAAVERLLERIVMRAIDVNRHLLLELSVGEEERSTRLSYRDTFLLLVGLGVLPNELADQIAPSAGLRNILAHDYKDADRRIVHAAIATCVDQYARYVKQVGQFLEQAGAE